MEEKNIWIITQTQGYLIEKKAVPGYLKDWAAEREIPVFATGSTDEPREIIQAVDDFFEKHKGVQHA